jgi:UDP-glucose 4-epimerase
MRVLITGAAGYIGSHIVVELLSQGYKVLALDNYSNSSATVYKQILDIVGTIDNVSLEVVKCDLRCLETTIEVVQRFKPHSVIHLAALKSVSESFLAPMDYYETNVAGSINLLKALDYIECVKLVFSSTAAVYGDAVYLPFDESHPIAPKSPYARSKRMVEQLLEDWVSAGHGRSCLALRYFNPVGAHSSGLIGERVENPSNLVPIVAEVALGKKSEVHVTGFNYDTPDGTGVRDYIHVVDLAKSHLCALHWVVDNFGIEFVNVGTGSGASVLDVIAAYERASGREIKVQLSSPRAGDTALSVADVSKARSLLCWQSVHDLDEMCQSSWAWVSALEDSK